MFNSLGTRTIRCCFSLHCPKSIQRFCAGFALLASVFSVTFFTANPLLAFPQTVEDAGKAVPTTTGVEKKPLPVIPEEPRFIDPGKFFPEQLATPVSVGFQSASLDQVVEWLRTTLQLSVVVRKMEIEEKSIFNEDVSITDSLNDAPVYLMLNRLSHVGIGWYYEDGTLYLTSLELVNYRSTTAPYLLGDLFDQKYTAAEIVSLIEKVLNPEEWEAAGGTGVLNVVGDVLFVRSNGTMHRKVQCLLEGVQHHARQTFIDMPAMDVQVREGLLKKVSVKFQSTPLVDSVREVSKLAGIDFRFDSGEIRSMGVRDRQPISMQMDDKPVSKILDLMLDELKLSWVIKDGVLWITSIDVAEKAQLTAFYDVRDLCANEKESKALSEAIIAQMGMDWSDAGGDSELMFPKPGTLVAWASLSTHAELLDLLEKYRFALRTTKVREAVPEVDLEKTVYYRLDANVAESLCRWLPSLVVPETWASNRSDATSDANGRSGTILLLESRSDVRSLSPKIEVGALEPKKVLIIHQKESVHREIREVISRVLQGDPDVAEDLESAPRLNGGMGGFGGGYFSVPTDLP